MVRLSITPQSGSAPLSVSIDASNSTSDSRIVAYSIDFGNFDGVYGESPSANHVYTVPGTYTVVVEAFDEEGDSGFTSATVTVAGEVPPAGSEADARLTLSTVSGTAPLTVRFDATGSSPQDDIVAYSIDFGNGVGYNGSAGKTAYTYTEPGIYRTTVEVFDRFGNSDYDAVTLRVNSGR